MDAARSALRLGAEHGWITDVLRLRCPPDLKATPCQRRVSTMTLHDPAAVLGDENGWVRGVILKNGAG